MRADFISGSVRFHDSKKSFDVFLRELVPYTDSGEWDEYSKAIGLNVVKELGNLTP